MIIYRRDLKKKVKNFLLYWEKKINDLESLIATAIEINDKFYEQTLKNRFYDSRDRADIYVGVKRDNAFKYGKQRDSHYETTSMKLDSVKRGKGKPLRKGNSRVINVTNRDISQGTVDRRTWCLNDSWTLCWR